MNEFCTKLIKQILLQSVGVHISDEEAQPHAEELERQLRESYREAGSPFGFTEDGFSKFLWYNLHNLDVKLD